MIYHQTSNINYTLGYKIIDHSDVVGAELVGAAPTTFSTPGFNELGKNRCKKRRETFQFWYLVQLILDVLW